MICNPDPLMELAWLEMDLISLFIFYALQMLLFICEELQIPRNGGCDSFLLGILKLNLIVLPLAASDIMRLTTLSKSFAMLTVSLAFTDEAWAFNPTDINRIARKNLSAL